MRTREITGGTRDRVNLGRSDTVTLDLDAGVVTHDGEVEAAGRPGLSVSPKVTRG